jgi:hypothetical protein
VTYTQKDIDDLIKSQKKISDPPKRQMKLVGAHWRNDCKVVANGIEGAFSIFIRRSEEVSVRANHLFD